MVRFQASASAEDVREDYEKARDKLVRFITGNDEDTFKDASESVKRQTGLLMSFLTQYTATSIMSGFMDTVEREGVNVSPPVAERRPSPSISSVRPARTSAPAASG